MLSMLRGPGGVFSRGVDLSVGEVDRDDRSLEVGGDERERGPAAAPGEGGRHKRKRKWGPRRLREELASIHVVFTSCRPAEVPQR